MTEGSRDNNSALPTSTSVATVQLRVDEELSKIARPLSAQEIEELEDDIRAKGCIVPIIVWNGVIIDGHNRYEICKKHNIPFKTEEMNFGSREDAKNWIITNQLARRNLGLYGRFELALKRHDINQLKEMAETKRNSNLKGKARSSNSELPKFGNSKINMQETLAREVGCSKGTISQMEFIKRKADEGKVPEEMLFELREDKIAVNSVYSALKRSEGSEVSASEGNKAHITATENATIKTLAKAESLKLRDLLELEPGMRRKLVNAIRDAQRNLKVMGTGLENFDKHPEEVRELAEGKIDFDRFFEILGMKKRKSAEDDRNQKGGDDNADYL